MPRSHLRSLALAVALALAGLGALALVGAGRVGDSVVARSGTVDERAATLVRGPSPPLRTDVFVSPARRSREANGVGSAVRGPAAGRVVAIDLRGDERPEPQGRLRLRVQRGPGAPGSDDPGPVEVEVEVRSGTFDLPGGDGPGRVDVLGGRLCGRAVFPAPAAMGLNPDGTLAAPLRVQLRTRARLVILDARTGMDVRDVRVVRGAPLAVVPLYPGEDPALLVDGADSPLTLELDPWKDYPLGIYVGAPGYAWQLSMATAEEDVERVVVLEPAGALEVSVDDGAGLEGATVRVLPAGDTPRGLSFNAPLGDVRGDEPLVLRSLLPAEYEVSVVVDGDASTPSVVVAQGRAEVAAGATGSVRLRVPSAFAAPASTAEVVIDLVVPDAWPREAVDVRLTAIGAGHPDRRPRAVSADPVEDSDRFRASVEALPLGEYELRIPAFAHRERLVVDGDARVTVSLPLPAEAEIRLTEEQAAASRWTVRFRSQDTGAFGFADRVEGEPLLQRFVAPPGEVDLFLLASDGRQFRGTGRLGGGRAFLSLTECVSVRLRTTYRGRPHPVSTVGSAPLSPLVEGPGNLVRSAAEYSVDNDVQVLVLSAPGRYVIRPAALPGYAAPEPIDVTLLPGEIPEIEVALRR